MKKTVFVLFLILILISSGFAGGRSQSGASSSGTGGAQVVNFLMGKDDPLDGFQAVTDAIRRNLNIRTNFEIIPGGTERDNIVKTRLATGDMADMFVYYPGSGLYDINAERNAMDITNESFAANLTDDFKRIASLNGRLYAIPGGSSAAGTILYNKAIYRELGLSVPRTWSEFIANCQKIQAAGRTAVIATLKDTWTSQIIILGDQYNVNVAQPNFPADYTANRPNGKYANNALARRGFEKIAEVRPFLNRDYMATTYEQGAEMLALGQGAHWPILTATLPLINSNYPDKIDDIGAFGVPGDDPNNAGLTVFPSNGFYIYRNTKVPDLAKQWVSYYLSQEGIAAFTSTEKPSGPFPIKGIVLTDTYSAVRELQPFIDQGKTGLALQFESPVKGPNLEQICVEVYAGYMSPMEAAIAYDQDVQKQAIQLNLPGW